MLMLGLTLLLAAAVLVAVATGVLAVPAPSIQRRARALGVPEDVAGNRRQKRSAEISAERLLGRLTGPSMLRRLERNLVLAGRPEAWSLKRTIVAKPAGAAVGLLFAVLVVAKTSSPLMVLFAVAMVILGYFVPDLLIYNRAIKRQQDIQKALPDVLDQIVISIEAGVGFEQALTKVAEGGSGPLAEEIVRLLQDISLGMARRDAYLALAGRTSVDELRMFAKAIIQAEEYGISVASVVRSQAQEMRLSRRMRAEARAQQVPVKILIPLMLCVLPVLFVVVLGPSVVSAYARN